MCVQGPPADTTALLERLFEQPLRLGAGDLARSVSHAGDGSRLRRALGKLLRGAAPPRRHPLGA